MINCFDVLGIGCVAVDDLVYVDAYPPADSKKRVTRSERRFGGLTGMALVAAARLGGRCAFAGLLGEDDLSQRVEDNFVEHGIDLSEAIRRNDAQPVHSVIVVAEDTGSRNIFFDSRSPIGADPAGPSEGLIRSSKVLFLDNLGIEGGIRAASIARDAGIPVVADFEDDFDPRFATLLELVDHLIVSQDFAARLTAEDDPGLAANRLMTDGRSVVIVTCGQDGSWSATPNEVRQQPAFKVKAVDTTGCGDVFHGAYALALARGDNFESRVRFASAAAALKAAHSEAPRAEQVEMMLAMNPQD